MPRKRKTRSYTATDAEYAEMVARLPYVTKDDEIDSLSRLIVHAIKRLPRSK